MLDKSSRSKSFAGLNAEDKDLTMFTITNLTLVLEKEDNMVYMGIKLKRKVITELVRVEVLSGNMAKTSMCRSFIRTLVKTSTCRSFI